MLCPRLLPRPFIGWPPGQPPSPVAVSLVRDRPGAKPVGVDIAYGAPFEGSRHTLRAHGWRNQPCCFFHFLIQRATRVPGARPATLGGRRGRLLEATGASYNGPYFGNHVRFFFRAGGTDFVASLHSFGTRPTTALLGRLVASLEPAETLRVAHRRADLGVDVGVTGSKALAVSGADLWLLTRERPINPATPWTGTRMNLIEADLGTGRTVARAVIAGEARALVATTTAVWIAVARERTPSTSVGVVLRVDPVTRAVVGATRTGTWPSALATDRRGVWVVNSAPFFKRGTLVHINGATNRIDRGPITIGPAPSGVAVGANSVWVADALTDSVRRIAVTSGRTLATIRVGQAPYAVVFSRDAAWVSNSEGKTLTRIDARTNSTASITVGRNPYGLAADARFVWSANLGSGTVTKVDAETGRVLSSFGAVTDPVLVAAAHDTTWIGQESGDTVERLP